MTSAWTDCCSPGSWSRTAIVWKCPGAALRRTRSAAASGLRPSRSIWFCRMVRAGKRWRAFDPEDFHGLGIPALANVAEVVEDVIAEFGLAGLVKLLVGPLQLAGGDVVTGVFQRSPVPIPPHLAKKIGRAH